jgi:cyclopropane-fatty-acyl-phospholipid synthase
MLNKSERIVSFINKAYLNNSGNSKIPFSIQLNGSKQIIGHGEPAFNLVFKNKSGINALASLDDTKILESYMAGDIDVEGEMIKAFELRGMFKDFHPLQYLWLFIQPLFFGQVKSDRKWIAQHYDLDENFFLSFLDKKHR